MAGKGVFGNNIDRMPNFSFRIMSFIFKIRDLLLNVDAILDQFAIKEGYTVVDYGCGPGSYIEKASRLVGASGRVFAVDVHELAIEAIKKKIQEKKYTNVTPILATKNTCSIASDSVDLIYALDMFHMVNDPTGLLVDMGRIAKRGGLLYIDNGHQSRAQAKEKIQNSKAWNIVEEHIRYMRCTPLKG